MTANITVTKQQLERYPKYLSYLQKLKDDGVDKISAKSLSSIGDCTEDQVRKDFQAINMEKGKPNTSRNIDSYIDCLENFLGYRNNKDAVIVGVGHLGKAFLNYDGFKEYGLNILAGFDIDKNIVGKSINNKKIFSINKLENLVERLNVRIAIITLPVNQAQGIVNRLVDAGIKAIWNFSHVHLEVPTDVIVEDIDLAASLSVLAYKLAEMDNKQK